MTLVDIITACCSQVALTGRSECDAPRARGRLPCCTMRGGNTKNGMRGMLITFWPDECYASAIRHEKQHGEERGLTLIRRTLVVNVSQSLSHVGLTRLSFCALPVLPRSAV